MTDPMSAALRAADSHVRATDRSHLRIELLNPAIEVTSWSKSSLKIARANSDISNLL